MISARKTTPHLMALGTGEVLANIPGAVKLKKGHKDNVGKLKGREAGKVEGREEGSEETTQFNGPRGRDNYLKLFGGGMQRRNRG